MRLDTIINRDALCALRELPAESVHCCVTSPPYYALRDYGMDAQIGREDTPEQYIARLVEVFRELKRVLRPDGTFWLNIADTYCGTGSKGAYTDPKNPKGRNGQSLSLARRAAGCKQKDLIGIPWLLAFALRSDGWYLRSAIIWQKDNPMPESVRDRPSRCYENVFLLTKSKSYYYDAAAIAEPIAPTTAARYRGGRSAGHKYDDEVPGQGKVQGINRARTGGYYDEALMPTTRNKRDVWHINTVSLAELTRLRQESAAAEQAVFDRLKTEAAAWEQQAGNTRFLEKAIEYVQTPPVKHTSNKWEKTDYEW